MSPTSIPFPRGPLSAVLTLEYGAALPEGVRSGVGYPVFGSNGVVGRHSRSLLDGPGIVVGRKGSVGEVRWSAEPFWPIDTAYFVQPRERANLRWIYWLLSWTDLRGLDAATGVPGLNRNDVYSVRAPMPEPAEQSCIAAVLDSLDEAIAKTEAVIAKLKRVRAGMLHALLTRGLDEHGQLRDPVAHPEQFKDSSLGRISKEWDLVALSGVATVDRGKFAHRPRNDPGFYGGRHRFIQTGDVALAAGGVITEASQSLNDRGASVSLEFPTGTIAVTIAANIGDTAILGRPMFFPDSVVGVVPKSPHVTRWVELTIRGAKRRLDALAPQSAQKNINLEFLRPLLVPMPTPEEQSRCAGVYEEISSQIGAEAHVLTKMYSTKSGLMTDLLTGRIRVPEGLEIG